MMQKSTCSILPSRIFLLGFFISSLCGAADIGGFLKGLGAAVQNKAQDKGAKTEGNPPPTQGELSGASPEVQKQQADNAVRVKNSLKATKTPPQSGSWTKIYNQRSIVFYYDASLIKQNGLYVSIPYLVDLPVANEINLLTEGRHPYKSVISVVNYDCSRRSLPPKSERYWATEDTFFFTENMASGDAMMDPARSKKVEWIEGFEGPGMTYEGAGSGQVNQAFFVNKVLNPELKICQSFWKAPEGFQAAKTPPYTQIKTPPCGPAKPRGGMMESCISTTNNTGQNVFKDDNQTFKTPGTYVGKFGNGSPNGFGSFTVQSGPLTGDMYWGFFSRGNFDGFGTYYNNANNNLKGSMYIGYFKDHKKHGPGIYRFSDGSPTQEGFWEEDKLVKPTKTFFIDTLKGLPLCQGEDALSWSDCFGYLEFESIQGQSLQRPSGNTYAGGFKDGLPNGAGSYFDKNKWLDYQGELKNGKFDGLGTVFYDFWGQTYYSGGFLEGKRHGKGRSVSGGGKNTLLEIYDGDYVNGSRSGQGSLYKEKDFKYVGGFKGNQFDGYGIFTPEHIPGGGDPVVKEGTWEKGKLLKPGQEPAADKSSNNSKKKK